MTFQGRWTHDAAELVLELEHRRLDAVCADEFKTAFSLALTGAERLPDRVVLDLRRVDSMDSAGLGALIAVLKRTRRMGVALHLRGVSPDVRELLDVTLVSRIFEIDEAPVSEPVPLAGGD